MSLAGVIMMAMGCSRTDSTPLSKLCDAYAEIADNKEAIGKAFQEVYAAPRDKQEALQQKAQTLAEELNHRNEALAEQAKGLGQELEGTEIKCEVSEGLGFTVEKAVFATVNTTPNMANIIVKGAVSGNADALQYVLFLNGDGDVVDRSMARYGDGNIAVNFQVTTNHGAAPAKSLGAVRSLKIVSETEYKTGKADGATPAADGNGGLYENEGNPDPEPAYEGAGEDGGSSVESVAVDGIVIKKGAPIAETLRKFKSVTWDYNADFGVTATVGNVWIVIDESDLTENGQEIINAIPSDMENNISFSVDYIKPAAKITQIEN